MSHLPPQAPGPRILAALQGRSRYRGTFTLYFPALSHISWRQRRPASGEIRQTGHPRRARDDRGPLPRYPAITRVLAHDPGRVPAELTAARYPGGAFTLFATEPIFSGSLPTITDAVEIVTRGASTRDGNHAGYFPATPQDRRVVATRRFPPGNSVTAGMGGSFRGFPRPVAAGPRSRRSSHHPSQDPSPSPLKML